MADFKSFWCQSPVEFPLTLSLHCHKTTGLVKYFDKKHMLLHAVCHLTLCTWLQTPDIPASTGTTFYFLHLPFLSGMHLKLLCVLNTL